MLKRVFLLGLVGLWLLVGTSAYAKVEPNCELGDAIFRPLKLDLPFGIGNGFGHCGIYCCSQSNKNKVSIGTEDPYPIQINDSDFKHSVIQGNGYRKDNPDWSPETKEVDFDTLDFALAGLEYWGACNNGGLNAKERRRIVATAYKQAVEFNCVYNHKDPNLIKKPATSPTEDGSFRCDGFVEYCYGIV